MSINNSSLLFKLLKACPIHGKSSLHLIERRNFGILPHHQWCRFKSEFSKVLTHSEKRTVAVPINIMYDVVLDVEKYKEFVPWCTKSVLLCKSKNSAKAKLAVGFGPIEEHYNSVVIFNNPKYVKAVCTDARIFNMLDCTWRFVEGDTPSSTVISFDVLFEFHSVLYTKLAQMFFDEVVKKMVAAFEARAHEKVIS